MTGGPPDPLTLRAYRAGTAALAPLAPLLLARRARRGKEDTARLGERRGLPTRPRPDGALVWLHGASVGETVSALPLARRLTARGHPVLVTSGTVTSAAVAAERLPEGAVHAYLPLDAPGFVRGFLDHWRPALGLLVESELWPNLIHGAHARGVPLVLVNGRLSERSFRRWRRLPRTARALLGRLDLCLAQSTPDAERLQALGAPRVAVSGNLKFDAAPLPAAPCAVEALRAAIGGRPTWIAASTHAGEEAMVAEAHATMAALYPNLLTILAPRHPARGDEVAALLAGRGLGVARRSLGQAPTAEVYLADTLGELGLLYRVGRVAFVGGTLVDRGGQNPVEPARLGAFVLHGPHVGNNREAYAALDRAGAAVEVRDAMELAREAGRRLADGTDAAAAPALATLGGALDRTMAALEPWLARMASTGSRAGTPATSPVAPEPMRQASGP